MKKFPRSSSLLTIVLLTCLVIIITAPAYMKHPVVIITKQQGMTIELLDQDADGNVDIKIQKLPNGLYRKGTINETDKDFFMAALKK